MDDTALGGGAEVEALRARISELDENSLDLILTQARTHNGWSGRPVSDAQIRRLFDILKMGPTSANCMPGRFIFVRTPEAKARLTPALVPGNVAKVEAAPVVAILGHDVEFWRHLSRLFPHKEMAVHYKDRPDFAEVNAFRNGTLQGAWLIIAARAMGLDTGAMSGFDNAKVDAEFFAGTTVKSNFLCCLGYGDTTKVLGKLPKFDFDEVCEII
ncbi:MAG: malonic semialdehyde reductase [Alphaproteobacteria bacterium]